MKFLRFTLFDDGVIDILKKEIVALSHDPSITSDNTVIYTKGGHSFCVRESQKEILALLESKKDIFGGLL